MGRNAVCNRALTIARDDLRVPPRPGATIINIGDIILAVPSDGREAVIDPNKRVLLGGYIDDLPAMRMPCASI